MLLCEEMFGVVRGLEIRELVEESTGETCPCRNEGPCPLGAKIGAQEGRPITLPR